jgi:hypothetical protein
MAAQVADNKTKAKVLGDMPKQLVARRGSLSQARREANQDNDKDGANTSQSQEDHARWFLSNANAG